MVVITTAVGARASTETALARRARGIQTRPRGAKLSARAGDATTARDGVPASDVAREDDARDVDGGMNARVDARALRPNAVWETGAATIGTAAAPAATRPPTNREIDYGRQLLASGGGIALAYGISKVKKVLDTPSRTYVPGANTVGAEYDAWTEEESLEYYWGEHIHLGYYRDEDLAKGAGTLLGHRVKDFIEAKEDFVDEMFAWSKVAANGVAPKKVLDVGCGIGGATRRLASKCVGPGSEVTGITLSPKQAARAAALAEQQGIKNAKFQVMDALAMTFEDNTFDMVWACESGEHMPDKKKYVEEMVRVLKPGGTLVIATWCQRHAPPALTKEEKSKLQFLYDEWAHPYFISIKDYCALAEGTGAMREVEGDDWTKQTIVSWRHSIWAGVYDPLPVFTRPKIWYKTLRDIICLERMRRAFGEGLMQYGMIRGVKKD